MAMAMCCGASLCRLLNDFAKKFRTEKLKSSHHYKTHTYRHCSSSSSKHVQSTEHMNGTSNRQKAIILYKKNYAKWEKTKSFFFYFSADLCTHFIELRTRSLCRAKKYKWVKLLKWLRFALLFPYLFVRNSSSPIP